MEIFNFIKKTILDSFRISRKRFIQRNNGYFLGVFWYLLEPLSLFFILLFLMEFVLKRPGDNYPLYLIIGLIIFNFFRGSTMKIVNSINPNTLNINYSPLVLVLSIFFYSIFVHIFEIIILLGLLIFYGSSPVGLIFYPFIFVLICCFTLGVSFLLFVLRMFFGDVVRLWTIFLRALWFITPNFYFLDSSSFLYTLNLLNPLFYFITITRQVILENRFPEIWMVIVIFYISLFTLLFGAYLFSKNIHRFNDLKIDEEETLEL